MKPIYRFDEIEKYLQSEETVLELLKNYDPLFKRVAIIEQRMRQNKINNSVEYKQNRFELNGIHGELNKISRMAYAFAQNVHDKAMIKARDEHCRNTPKDEKGKLLPFSSTMAKAQAGVESYQYFRVANYLRGIIESIEQNLMALGGESKNYNRFGQNAENSISDSDKTDEELED